MASDVQIVNLAAVLLGQSRIANLTENSKMAREANAIYEIVRNSLLATYNWTFAKERAALPALVDVPAFQFSVKYQLPADCCRLVELADLYVGVDLTDYRGSDMSEFEIEGDKILTNFAAPLNIKYIKRVTDPARFSDPFVLSFGAKLAWHLAEAITQSNSKKENAERVYMRSISDAVRANAIQMPPRKLADDEWVMSRL